MTAPVSNVAGLLPPALQKMQHHVILQSSRMDGEAFVVHLAFLTNPQAPQQQTTGLLSIILQALLHIVPQVNIFLPSRGV